jgi:hypothetical protein
MTPSGRIKAPAGRDGRRTHQDGPRRLTLLVDGLTPARDWLTMAQLAAHGKFMAKDGVSFSPEAARKFVTRHKDLPRGRRGRQLMVDRATFDRYVANAGRAVA